MTTVIAAKLPAVRGRYRFNADLKSMVWFRVGGPAEVLYKPADPADLSFFLHNLPLEIPVTILGVGSNVLIRDGGILGVVIKLARGFTDVQNDQNSIKVGAGALGKTVALSAAEHSIGGLEFLSGIPGTIGGVIKMNGGAYGSEIKDILLSCTCVDRSGNMHVLSKNDIIFTYRHSSIPDDYYILDATLQGTPGDKEEIHRRLEDILDAREKSQPIRARTGGSTFKNPKDNHAWRLIDDAGCRGLQYGGAQISEKHCNFLINTGTATANDIETLGDMVQQKVKEKMNISLEWEIIKLGKK